MHVLSKGTSQYPRGLLYRVTAWPPSKYIPHQGAKECLRRRMGGNAKRIRMQRAGMKWDDATGQYVAA